ncbi:hypothetical protein ACOMHN_052566 [Nucella lapillus]
MAAPSAISSEMCSMEQCEGQSEVLSSADLDDDGGFLSSSCMETDEKNDPFTSDNALVFPEDTSRFDSECILSSSLVEGVPMQQTTPCDTSVSSFMSGDALGSCSMLSGSSFLLYDIPGSSVTKPTNPVPMPPSNVILMGGADLKGPEQKVDLLPPVHLLTPSVSLSQPHPVVLGNSNAASFVRSVLKDSTLLSPTSSSSPAASKQTVTVPPVMFLNSALLSPFSVLQSVPGVSSSPLLIQLPSGFAGATASTQCTQQLVSSLGSTISQCNNLITTSVALPVDMTSVSTGHFSPETSIPMTLTDSLNPGSTSCATLSPVAPSLLPVSASSLSLHNTTTNEFKVVESTSVSDSNNIDSSAIATDTVGSSINLCESPALQVGENPVPKAPLHPIVISCVKPDDKNSKGMKQILKHFLQQNKANTAASKSENSQPVNVSLNPNLLDSACSSACVNADDLKPQIVSVSDFENSCSSSLFTVPSLGRKSSSVVLILRRTDTQVNDPHNVNKLLPSQTASSSAGDKSFNSCPSSIEDEIDGSAVHAATKLTVDNTQSSESREHPSQPSCSCESSDTQQSGKNNDTSDGSNRYEWVQVQVPANANHAEETKMVVGDGSDDLQKLIPLTVSEKLSSDLGRPIIICIIQEDGMMKKVNINPLEANQDAEMKEGADREKETVDTSIPTSMADPSANPVSADSPSIPGGSAQPASTSHTDTQPSVLVSPSPSHSSAELSSPSSSSSLSPPTGTESGSPPVLVAPSMKTARDKCYKCDLCTAVFSRMGNYTRHRKIHTLNLKEDIHFKCPYCERPFLQRCDMNRHIAVHTDQYPFRCQTCNKGYIRKSDLVVHERFHSKNKAFKCDTCGRAFYQSGDLSRHKRFVHMEQSQLSCGHCHRKYASEVTLIRHIKTAHNDILLQSAAQHTQPQVVMN